MRNTSLVALAAIVATPAVAADKAPPPQLTKCQASLGTIAVVDGDTQGWTKYGLGSPRELIAAMAQQSGCFTIHAAASGRPADYLVTAIAGDKEEVDQAVDLARTAVIEGAVRSGALTAVAGRVPVVGGMLGMFGGFGGKKKTYAAGLKVVSPATGQTVVTGSGEAKRSVITFGGAGGLAAGMAGGYASSKDGQMLSTAFVQAFNSVVAQGSALTASRSATPAASAASAASYVTAVDTRMYGAADRKSVVRSLRAASSLTPTGKRQGLFVEVKDNYGTTGWVSVEDLK